MFLHALPSIIKKLFPKFYWEIPPLDHSDRRIYFTFDDGPTPEITKFVLDELKKADATATFFCIGKNIQENPNLITEIVNAQCTIGNHTMNHLNAWKVSPKEYLENIESCEKLIEAYGAQSVGFRPPYGRFTRIFYKNFISHKIFMWTILTGDYNKNLNPESILKKCIPKLKPGQILIFHDSIKAFPILKIILPQLLLECKKLNLKPSAL